MMEEPFEISGLQGKWIEVQHRYNYDADKCHCPVCGKVGIPWKGWFNCTNPEHKSLVQDGRTFMRVA